MSKTGGGIGTNQYKIRGTSQARRAGAGTDGESSVALAERPEEQNLWGLDVGEAAEAISHVGEDVYHHGDEVTVGTVIADDGTNCEAVIEAADGGFDVYTRRYTGDGSADECVTGDVTHFEDYESADRHQGALMDELYKQNLSQRAAQPDQVTVVGDRTYQPGEIVDTMEVTDGETGEAVHANIEARDGGFYVYEERSGRDVGGDAAWYQDIDEARDAMENIALEAAQLPYEDEAPQRPSLAETGWNDDDKSENRAFHYNPPFDARMTSAVAAFRGEVAERIMAAPSDRPKTAEQLADEINDDYSEDGVPGDQEHQEVSEADVEYVLTDMRNAGQLDRVDDGYIPRARPRPYPAGESITTDRMVQALPAGTNVEVDVHSADGVDYATPLQKTAKVDLDRTGTKLTLYDDDGDITIDLDDPDITVTEAKDGWITLDLPQHIGPKNPASRNLAGNPLANQVHSGTRVRLRTAGEDSFSGVRPLIDDNGRESPFDVGPRQHRSHPFFAADSDVVALQQDVYDPALGKVGTIYQDSDGGWGIASAKNGNGDREHEFFSDPVEAATFLHRQAGGRGNWAKPTAENVALPGLEEL